MEYSSHSLYGINIFQRPWILDVDRGVLIDFIFPDKMLYHKANDDPGGGYTFHVPNPKGADHHAMLLRVNKHTSLPTEGREIQHWIEVRSIVGDSESVSTMRGSSVKRQQVFTLFKEDPLSSRKNPVDATTDRINANKSDYPYLAIATFEHPDLHVRDAIFYVDFKNFELIDAEDRKNIIRISDIRDNGSGYEFYYDPKTKNKVEVPLGFEEEDTGPYLVRFNYLAALHPYGMAIHHHVPVGVIQARTDNEFMEKLNQWKERNRAHQRDTKANRQKNTKGRKLN